ncbi:hypothetical protein [Bacillus thuringiensis]|nr:hypothetical protein [Bacillus thuringiensis]
MSKEKEELKSWRKAAEVFNASKSERTIEDVKQELKKIRSEKTDDK